LTLKNLLPSALAAATIVLAGCNTDPTVQGVGGDAALITVYGRAQVSGKPEAGEAGDRVPAQLMEVEIGIPTAEINLSSEEKVKVVIPTTLELDASAIDPETVTLGDGRRAGTPVLRKKSGKLMAGLEDHDADGDLDLVLHFAVHDLVSGGDLSASSTELVLEGSTYGGSPIRGSAAVTPRTLEPKPILPPSRIDGILRIASLRATPAVWPEV
jgi:predicted small secreted protein